MSGRACTLCGRPRVGPERHANRSAAALEDRGPGSARRGGPAAGPAAAGRPDESKLLALATKDASPFVRMQAILQLRNRPSLKRSFLYWPTRIPYLMGAAALQCWAGSA